MTMPLDSTEMGWVTQKVAALDSYFNAVVVGQDTLRRALLVTLLAKGHILVESVPGLAKTLAASTLARSVDGSFSRVQCTPDLLPSDIVGTQVFDPSTTRFHTELGPVHANFVLLDEINRSSAKTQSAMLESMQERQTTIGGQTYLLPNPFMVMATQNPIEEEGTYVLPQAQMDRFLLKEAISHPSAAAEFEVLTRIEQQAFNKHAPAVATVEDVARLQRAAAAVTMDDSIKRYIVELVGVTRNPAAFLDSEVAHWIDHGASPRGSIAFLQVARAHALLNGRAHVIPDDVVVMRHAILRHRIVVTFEALAEQVSVDGIIDSVFDAVPVP